MKYGAQERQQVSLLYPFMKAFWCWFNSQQMFIRLYSLLENIRNLFMAKHLPFKFNKKHYIVTNWIQFAFCSRKLFTGCLRKWMLLSLKIVLPRKVIPLYWQGCHIYQCIKHSKHRRSYFDAGKTNIDPLYWVINSGMHKILVLDWFMTHILISGL